MISQSLLTMKNTIRGKAGDPFLLFTGKLYLNSQSYSLQSMKCDIADVMSCCESCLLVLEMAVMPCQYVSSLSTMLLVIKRSCNSMICNGLTWCVKATTCLADGSTHFQMKMTYICSWLSSSRAAARECHKRLSWWGERYWLVWHN
jgi:hypothetical protein